MKRKFWRQTGQAAGSNSKTATWHVVKVNNSFNNLVAVHLPDLLKTGDIFRCCKDNNTYQG
eukprot:scaffold593809_cov17-Prasinocladus_malaysianus.AAC.1